MLRPAFFVECVDLQPAEIKSKACCPNDRSHAGLRQIQLENWIGHAVRVRVDIAGFGLLRKVQTIAGDISVGFVQHRQVVGIPQREIVRKIRREAHHALFEGLRHTNERHPLCGKTPEVDRVAAMGTAHRDRDMGHARLDGRGIPLAEDPQPPAEVTLAIASRRTVVRTDREVNTLSRTQEFVRDLHPEDPAPTTRPHPQATGRDCGRRWNGIA